MTVKIRALPLVLMVLAVAAALLAYWGYQTHLVLADRLAAAEPRFARQAGLLAAQADMQQQFDQIVTLLARHAYPSTTDASQAANDAQQRIRSVFTQAGADVLSLQVLAARSGPGFDAIPLSIRVDGDMAQIQAALLTLRTLAPAVYVDGFSIQTGAIANDNSAVKVVGQFELFVIRDQAP
ncbi:MAG TPA: type II secretion system protein GspM [Burkholderiaceae bacterium]|nr:type II secretion system protein GspM [Burkholderiaceae bacterium]